MALLTSNAAELELLDKMLKDALSTNENYILKLYKNNYTVSDTYTPASFTEADFTNYAARTLTRSNWSSAVTVSGKAQSSYAVQSWTCGTTGNTIYGYYVTGSNSSVVLWAETFATARIIAESDVLSVQPQFTLDHA